MGYFDKTPSSPTSHSCHGQGGRGLGRPRVWGGSTAGGGTGHTGRGRGRGQGARGGGRGREGEGGRGGGEREGAGLGCDTWGETKKRLGE
jgi:hypothetical protein